MLVEVRACCAFYSLFTGCVGFEQNKLIYLCKDIDELVANLLGYNHDDWMWLEALPFLSMLPEKATKRGKKNDPADRLVTTHELYETLLAPFDSWVFTEED